MQRVTRSTAIATQPPPPGSPGAPGFFTGGDPGGGVPATIPGYEWFNSVQEELAGIVLRAGLALDGADQAQVRKALDRLHGGGLRGVTANTTLTADDAGVVLVNAAGGNVTVTLPAAAAANGRPLRLVLARTDTSANTVTIQRAGSDTIEGLTSLLLAQRRRLTLVSDGVSGWIILAGDVATSLPTGMLVESTTGTVLPGTVAANGALLSRATFPALFAFANAGGLVTEAAWSAGDWGRFSVGDGSTTFRIPDHRGEFRRGADGGRGVDAGRVIGSAQAATTIQNGPDAPNLNPLNLPITNVDSQAAGGNRYVVPNASPGSISTGSLVFGVRPRNIATLVCIVF